MRGKILRACTRTPSATAEARDAIDSGARPSAARPRRLSSTRWVVMGHSQGCGHRAVHDGHRRAWAPEVPVARRRRGGPRGVHLAVHRDRSWKRTRAGVRPSRLRRSSCKAAASGGPGDQVWIRIFDAGRAGRWCLSYAELLIARANSSCRLLVGRALVPATSFRCRRFDLGSAAPRFAAQNDAGPLHPAVPLLIVHGSADTTIPLADRATRSTRSSCTRAARPFARTVYPGFWKHSPRWFLAAMNEALDNGSARASPGSRRRRTWTTANGG